MRAVEGFAFFETIGAAGGEVFFCVGLGGLVGGCVGACGQGERGEKERKEERKEKGDGRHDEE